MAGFDVRGDSPEAVALALMERIAEAEDMYFGAAGEKAVTREWILSTYSQCLQATLGSAAIEDNLRSGIEASA